jgi:hypothetical protein
LESSSRAASGQRAARPKSLGLPPLHRTNYRGPLHSGKYCEGNNRLPSTIVQPQYSLRTVYRPSNCAQVWSIAAPCPPCSACFKRRMGKNKRRFQALICCRHANSVQNRASISRVLSRNSQRKPRGSVEGHCVPDR